ncbi:hypothetical protein [Achromobacter aegrifaciens]
MSLIVAARFDTFDQAAMAARQLCAEGYTEDDIHTFYINTAGEHARYPIGGDRVGAYLGALAGALWVVGRGRRREPGAPAAPDVHPDVRQAGVMLALHVSPDRDALARTVLTEAGGRDIERAQGRWLDGKWEDFDPLTPPRRVEAPTMAN